MGCGPVKRYLVLLALCFALVPASGSAQEAKASQPKVLIFYSLNVENDHVLFASDALRFFAALASYIFALSAACAEGQVASMPLNLKTEQGSEFFT